jgi:hypothetical protein
MTEDPEPPERETTDPQREPADQRREAGSDDLQKEVESDGLSPEEAFGLLANETRLALLRALWDAPEDVVPFAELQRRTPAGTSNLEYHLEKLVGHFVRRTGDGYGLRYAGEQVMRAVLTGVLTEDPSLPPREIDERCPYCGATVEFRYRDEHLTARCTDCGGVVGNGYPPGTFMSYGFPPAGLKGRSPEQALEAAHVFYDSMITPMMDGVCPECAATVSHSFEICDDHALGEDGICVTCGTRFEVWVEYVCDRCQYSRSAPVWFEVLTEPEVIAFYHEQGGLEESVPFSKHTWENAPYVRNIDTTVVDEDPLRFEVSIPLGHVELRVTLDDDLQMVETERVERL